MWAEKYRPKKLDEVVGQEHVVNRLKEMIKTGNVPHMLFYGPPGCGKTSVAYAFANELGIPIVEFNASDERGINTIREKIKPLAMLKDKRIILLDEADSMTDDAQHALRRIMEKGNAIFVLTANDEWKIIDPIKSRCAIFRFKKLSTEEIVSVIAKVLKSEGIKLKFSDDVKKALEFLIDYADGDLRKILNSLETLVSSNKELTIEVVKSLVYPDLASRALTFALDGNFEQALRLVEDALVLNKVDAYSVINSLYKSIKSLDTPQHIKLRLYERLADIEANIKVGCNPTIQLASFIATVTLALSELREKR